MDLFPRSPQRNERANPVATMTRPQRDEYDEVFKSTPAAKDDSRSWPEIINSTMVAVIALGLMIGGIANQSMVAVVGGLVLWAMVGIGERLMDIRGLLRQQLSQED
jgi:hypothetical protein